MLAQSCHCAFEFAKCHPLLCKNWMDISNYICVLEVGNENCLKILLEEAEMENIAYSVFREPDLHNSITAIALAPGSKSKKLCSGLKLALHQLGKI